MSVISERAPAKINLTLKVRGRRPDGYHEIESLIAFAHNSADGVAFRPGPVVGVTSTGRFADAIVGPNLIETAFERLAATHPELTLGHVELEKNLPVAAGVGGGSSDAAAVLRAVRRANPDVERVDWLAMAQSLGADVPVCFEARPALACGMGDTVLRLPGLPRLDVVLVNPLATVPSDKTARVFARLKAPPAATDDTMRTLPLFASSAELVEAMRVKGNDLARAAEEVVPEIGGVLGALQTLPGVLCAGLSGAGPTCFAVFGSAPEAADAAAALQQAAPQWWVAADTLGG